MNASGFIVKFFDKKYEKLSLEELCEAPIWARAQLNHRGLWPLHIVSFPPFLRLNARH